MNSSDKRKLPILIVLLALLLLSAFFNFSRSPGPVAPSAYTSIRPLPKALPPEALPSIETLMRTPNEVAEVQRNLFQFGEEGKVQNDKDADDADKEADESEATAQSVPAPPDVRYLGFYQEKGRSNARLGAISNGGKIYVGAVGDVLASQYQVLQIQSSSIVLRLLSDNKIMRFTLGKDTPPVEVKSWNTSRIPAVSNLQEQ
jgi:hypothetical protein